jgi:hypothetical protein
MNHPPPSYLELKPQLLRAGLLSCSQQGFNIARGALTHLRDRLWGRLATSISLDEVWDTPPLIRSDWVVRGVWQDPPEAQWLSASPGGQLLTPRPLMHLLSRLRWHPTAEGSWLLRGPAFRDEQDTLPLLRQRCFTLLEYVVLAADAPRQLETYFEILHHLLEQILLAAGRAPAALLQEDGALCTRLALPDTAPVTLLRGACVTDPVLRGYGLEQQVIGSVGLSLERLCLLVLAACGPDEAHWPRLG